MSGAAPTTEDLLSAVVGAGEISLGWEGIDAFRAKRWPRFRGA